MINLIIEERSLLVRDLDDWRNLVEFLRFNNVVRQGNKALDELDKAMQAMIFASTNIEEQHTRH